MIKKYWKTIVITTLVIVMPVLVGVTYWNRLPDMVPTHWNAQNEIDGWMPKLLAVLMMPAIMLAVQWFVIICFAFDKKSQNLSSKVIIFSFWIVPATSVFVEALTVGAALGLAFDVGMLTFAFVGILWIVMGNFMGKAKFNYVFGIRIPTTLNDQNNWFHTHRVAGFVWTIAGIVMLFNAPFTNTVVMAVSCAASAIIPIAYSFVYAARHKDEPSAEEKTGGEHD